MYVFLEDTLIVLYNSSKNNNKSKYHYNLRL